MATPTQSGTALQVTATPTFSSFVVIDGTWKVKDTTSHVETMNGQSKTENFTFYNPGTEVTAEWTIKSGQTAAAKGDVVTGSGTKFLVLEAETSEYGGRPLKQSVTLVTRESVTLA